MEGKRPQTLEMTKVWPLPHPYKINPAKDEKTGSSLRVQNYFPLTTTQHALL